jgi:hypothetical protein
MSGDYKVDLEDKFSLDYILIKHFQLWQDINRNRKMYVGTLTDSEWLWEAGFSEDEYIKQRREHIKAQLELITSEQQRGLVQNTLESLFPQLKHIIDGQPKAYEDLVKWQQERRVAHPDVLDTYFGSSSRDELYTQENKLVNQKLKGADKLTERHLQGRFKSLFAEADDEENNESNLMTIIREYVLREFKDEALTRVLRGGLRAYLSSTNYVVRDENRIFIRLLSLINTALERISDKEQQQIMLEYIFSDVEKSILHPTTGLRLLLYIHPSRDNHFFALKDFRGMNKLYERVLAFVDDYYINKQRDVFREGKGIESGEWRFVIYQWALSISTDGKVNNTIEVPFPDLRYTNVNNYVFGILDDDEELAYTFIKKQFWGNDIYDTEDKEKWLIRGNIEPYERERLDKLAMNLANNSKLSIRKKNEVRAFLEELRGLGYGK